MKKAKIAPCSAAVVDQLTRPATLDDHFISSLLDENEASSNYGTFDDTRTKENWTKNTKMMREEEEGRENVDDENAMTMKTMTPMVDEGRGDEQEEEPFVTHQDAHESVQGNKFVAALKVVWPHASLWLLSSVYVISGALILIALEKPTFLEQQNNRSQKIKDFQRDLLDDLTRLSIELKNNKLSFDKIAGEKFDDFVAEMHKLHRASKAARNLAGGGSGGDRSDEETDGDWINQWNFESAVFCITSTLLTIGYGNLVPSTQKGKIFLVAYCIVGIPLLILTTTDVAKFLSSVVNAFYVEYLTLKYKIAAFLRLKTRRFSVRRRRNRPTASRSPSSRSTAAATADDDDGPVIEGEENTEKMAEYLWSNIDTVHYVKVPATLLLIIVMAYSCFGGLMLTYYESNWSFLHGLYFSVTSVLKVGFGDLLPTNRKFELVSLTYILFGLIVATMCVDVVGLQYVHKIHQLGRVAQENADYLNVIQRAKYRKKKREALKTLFGMLAFVNRASEPSAMSIRSRRKSNGTVNSGGAVCAPLVPPTNVQVTSISPYSIGVAWMYDDKPGSVTFNLTYKMKQTKNQVPVVITDIDAFECEIRALKSFSIYEIGLVSVNQHGESESVKIVQITEPETSPQDLKVFLLTSTSVRLTWRPPYKKQIDVRKYAVYYTQDVTAPFEKWSKVFFDVPNLEGRIGNLEDAEWYAFCISSVYDRGHSPISRTVYPAGSVAAVVDDIVQL